MNCQYKSGCKVLNSIVISRRAHALLIHATHCSDSDSDSDSNSEIIYSATYHTITIFTYIWFQYNGPMRPPLRQHWVAGMGATEMRYLYVHVYIIFYIYRYIYIIIHNNRWLARNKYIT